MILSLLLDGILTNYLPYLVNNLSLLTPLLTLISLLIIYPFYQKNHEKYGFNLMGVVSAAGNYHLKRKDSYYCAEFVKYVLDHTSMKLNLPDAIKPNDFQKLEGTHEVFVGIMSEYSPN